MHKFTIGVEEEFQIVDAKTRQLKSHMSEIIEGGKVILQERIKKEMHQAVVEMGTNICENVNQAEDEVGFLRRHLIQLAESKGLRVAASATHPFSHWSEQAITEDPRYDVIVDELKDVARSNLIFGLHVHVAIPSREEGIKIMNVVRYFLPHVYALSTNSPFWIGRDTGYKAYRTKVFDKFPRTGIPPSFISVAEYDNYVNLLIKTNCIDNAKKIWWDIRLHPFFPTIEFRICDMPMRLEETICLAAIMQALVAKIYKLHQKNLNFRQYNRILINENKWRACRYGIHAKLIDFGREEEVPFSHLANELMEFIDDVVDDLGSREQVMRLFKILQNGTGADRQLAVFESSGKNMNALVDYIIQETKVGL